MTMLRLTVIQEAVDRLCDVYAGSYDVTRCEENEHALAATMDQKDVTQ